MPAVPASRPTSGQDAARETYYKADSDAAATWQVLSLSEAFPCDALLGWRPRSIATICRAMSIHLREDAESEDVLEFTQTLMNSPIDVLTSALKLLQGYTC